MYIPSPASKTPRFFQPCPGNDEYQLEPGMYGIKDVSGGSEAWYRPFKTLVGDANPDPILIATAADIAAIVAGYVAKATFDANTILKADTDDTPSPLTVGASTIIGRASTGGIAALTAAQVATIINSSIAHNSTSGLNTGNYRHVDPSPAIGVTALEITDADFTGLGDSVNVKSVDTTKLQDVTNGGSYFDSKWADGGENLFYILSDMLYKVDKRTLLEISNSSVGVTAPFASDNRIAYLIAPTYIRIVDTETFLYSDVVNTNGTVYDAKIGPDGNLYFVNSTGGYFVRDASGGAIATGTLVGLTNVPVAIDVDSTHLYVLDATVSSSGTVVLRKFDLATFTLQSSLVLTPSATSNGEIWSSIYVNNSSVYVSYTAGNTTSASNQRIALVLKSSLTLNYTSSGTNPGYKGVFSDGFFIISDANSHQRYSIPSLTLKSSGHLDLTGVKSSAYNNGVGIYSLDDFCRATEHAKDTTIHLTATQKTDLIDEGDSALHYHSTDRDRANHTGTQAASTISDFDTEVSNNTDVAANTAARHDAVTVADTAEIDMSITGQQISATLVASSIDETKLDASVNASLDLADSAVQRSTVRSSATTTEIVTSDENDIVRITSARTSDIAITINSAVLAIEGFRFTISVDYNASYVAYIGTAPPGGPGWSMNGNSTSSVAQNFEFTVVNGVAVPTVAPTAYYVPA